MFLSFYPFPVFLHLQKFQLPQSSSRWKRKLYSFLHDKLKLPGNHLVELYLPFNIKYLLIEFFLLSFMIDILLMAIFSLSLKAWAVIVLWFMLAPVAHKFDLGPLFVSLLLSFGSGCL
jgi:hypothetical protein